MKSRHGCACNTQLAQRQFESAILELQPEYFEFSGGSDEEVVDWLQEIFGSDKPALAQKGAAAAVAAKARKVADKAIAAIQAEKTCWIQTVLNKAGGESLVVDGVYGPLTREATRRFQARNGLTVDGIVGPQTETALIQAALNQIAQASLLPINGIMDARTQQEIRRFQSQNNLAPDGIVGPKTRATMVAALGGRCEARQGPTSKPAPKPTPKPTPTPTCDKAELARRVNECIEDSKRCLIAAHEDLALALAGCLLKPVCNAAAMGKYLLALKRCRDALLRCDQAAKAATNCP